MMTIRLDRLATLDLSHLSPQDIELMRQITKVLGAMLEKPLSNPIIENNDDEKHRYPSTPREIEWIQEEDESSASSAESDEEEAPITPVLLPVKAAPYRWNYARQIAMIGILVVGLIASAYFLFSKRETPTVFSLKDLL